MTADELKQLCAVDGFYILGDRRHGTRCNQPITVICHTPYLCRLGTELSQDPTLWNEHTYVSGGPISVAYLDSLSEKAQAVADEVVLLENDLAFWRGLAIKAKQLIKLASWDTASPGTSQFAANLLRQINDAEVAEADAAKRKEQAA